MRSDIVQLASEFGVSKTLPELKGDIDAQMKALLDPDHPKQAVFLARGQELPNWTIPAGIFVETRPEGTLITDSALLAAAFSTAEVLTDAHLAEILGYPVSKAEVMRAGGGAVVQAIDENGYVVFEAATTQDLLKTTMEAAENQVPMGGHVCVTTIEAAIARRMPRMN